MEKKEDVVKMLETKGGNGDDLTGPAVCHRAGEHSVAETVGVWFLIVPSLERHTGSLPISVPRSLFCFHFGEFEQDSDFSVKEQTLTGHKRGSLQPFILASRKCLLSTY